MEHTPPPRAAATSENMGCARCTKLAALLLAFHFFVWTLVPWAVNDALPLDTIEALAWGREWAMGYDKHPPLSAWAAELAGYASGGADVGLYALSALCTAVGLGVMWLLTRRLLGAKRALLALVLSEGVLYHHFTSPEFNVNVLQIPLWASAMYAYWRGSDAKNKTGGLHWWALLGVCAGAALLSKYLAGALLIAMAIDTLRHQRRVLATPGPYVAALICLAVFAPHALWMVEHDFVSLTYGVDRASGGSESFLNHLAYPLKFLGAQIAAAAALGWLLLVWKPSKRPKREEERRARAFFFWMTIGPIGSLLALSLVTGFELRSMWATPMLLALAPCAMAFLDVRYPSVKKIDGTLWACVIVLAPVIAYAAISAMTMQHRDKPKRVNYPGVALGHEAQRVWDEHAEGPLLFVVGEEWEGGLVGWYAPDRPSVYIGADPVRAQWANDDLVRSTGALIVWTKARRADSETITPMPYDPSRFGDVRELPDLVIPYPSAPDKPGARFGVALIPPAGG